MLAVGRVRIYNECTSVCMYARYVCMYTSTAVVRLEAFSLKTIHWYSTGTVGKAFFFLSGQLLYIVSAGPAIRCTSFPPVARLKKKTFRTGVLVLL